MLQFHHMMSASGVRRLDSVRDLNIIYSVESVPKHSLILLYWFANTIDIDGQDIMKLTFDVNRGDYGSHCFHNFETLLDPPPPEYRYYTIGNLYQDQSRLLPNYVVNPPPEYAGDNRDRIIIRVQMLNLGGGGGEIIDRVYITQHHSGHQGSSYDSRHTYQITTNLLKELRLFCIKENQLQLSHLKKQFKSNVNHFQLNHIQNMWPGYAGLGLLMHIVTKESKLLQELFKCSITAVGLILLVLLLLLCSMFGIPPPK